MATISQCKHGRISGGCEWCEKDERIIELEEKNQLAYDIAVMQSKEIERLRGRIKIIKCPDNAGGLHRWNGDGQCLDCCNYATDLNDAALEGK